MELVETVGPLEFEKVSVEDAKRASNREDRSAAVASDTTAFGDDELLDATATWLSQLPSSVRPLDVGRHHRRIANKLSALWKQHAAGEAYFDTLLRDRPADHPPLAPKILAELTALRKYRATLDVDGKARSRSELRASTLEWIEQLPHRCRPLAIPRQFPHIANRLCEIWKRPVVCDNYFNELAIDRRGGRMGFPMEVVTEIGLLREYYGRLYPYTHGGLKDVDFAR